MASNLNRRASWSAASRLALFALTLLAPALLGAAYAPASSTPYKLVENTYNARYCEVFLVDGSGSPGQPIPPLSIRIFNTIGVNKCPQEKWDALGWTPYGNGGQVSETVKQEQGVDLAVANGPRHWVLDAIGGRNIPPAVSVGGLQMREVALLELNSLAPPTFVPFEIQRDTRWVFNKGRMVRELRGPDGHRYLMQAYNGKSIRPERQLDHLDRVSGMGLPEDWEFRAFRTKKKLVLTAAGSATIVRDGLKSVYQLYQ